MTIPPIAPPLMEDVDVDDFEEDDDVGEAPEEEAEDAAAAAASALDRMVTMFEVEPDSNTH